MRKSVWSYLWIAFRRHGVAALNNLSDRYQRWINLFDRPTGNEVLRLRKLSDALPYKPRFVVVIDAGQAEEEMVAFTIHSIQAQVYSNWKVIVLVEEKRVEHFKRSLGANSVLISSSASVIEEEGLSPADYLTWLNAGDVLSLDAFYLIAAELSERSDVQWVYSDEDHLGVDSRRHSPRFFPNWDRTLVRTGELQPSFNIISYALAQKNLSSCERPTHEELLRLGMSVLPRSIKHVPFVLCHVGRSGTGSRKLVHPAAPAAVVREPHPKVSVIIPTRDQVHLLQACIDGLLKRTDYSQVEIIVIDNDSQLATSHEYLQRLAEEPSIQILHSSAEFNFSALNNLAVRHATGDVLALLNNDIEVLHPEWLQEMVNLASHSDVGVVGAKLYFPDGRIQHSGIHVQDYQGVVARHLLRDISSVRSVAAVTGACMVLRKEVFARLGGLTEELPGDNNDIDLCLRSWREDLQVLITPYARLTHHESATRKALTSAARTADAERAKDYIRKKFPAELVEDKFFNPNLPWSDHEPDPTFQPRKIKPYFENVDSLAPWLTASATRSRS